MRRFSTPLSITFLLYSFSSFVSATPAKLELDLSGLDYRALLEKPENRNAIKKYQARHFTDTEDLTPIMNAGKRFLDWLITINNTRDAAHKISLTSESTQAGIPITQPAKSNPAIVTNRFNTFKAQAPVWFRDVVFSQQTLPTTLAVSDEEFIQVGRVINNIYERASRWILQEPNLAAYAELKSQDVRGYYFLTHEPNIQAKLTGFYQLPASEQAQLSTWLVNLCASGFRSEADCQGSLSQATVSQGDVYAFYQSYLPSGKEKWDGFFQLRSPRNDVTWTSANPLLFTIPFVKPENNELINYLSSNIEDEWRWQSWQLKLAFQDESNFNTAHLEFEAGTTPHVNTLGGSVITMDANAPLTEYNVRWAIRHEFGHVLGFPDCYVEFYDENEKVMISYQLDITNLMCSRRGKLKQTHYDELKQNYFRN